MNKTLYRSQWRRTTEYIGHRDGVLDVNTAPWNTSCFATCSLGAAHRPHGVDGPRLWRSRNQGPAAGRLAVARGTADRTARIWVLNANPFVYSYCGHRGAGASHWQSPRGSIGEAAPLTSAEEGAGQRGTRRGPGPVNSVRFHPHEPIACTGSVPGVPALAAGEEMLTGSRFGGRPGRRVPPPPASGDRTLHLWRVPALTLRTVAQIAKASTVR